MRHSLLYTLLISIIVMGSVNACPDHDKKHGSQAAKHTQAVGMQAKDIWARTSSGKTSAVYMMLHNAQPFDDELISVRTPVCERVELHETREENGVYGMYPVASLHIKATEGRVLKPGGHHIMLIGLKQPLKKGEMIPLTLVFKKAPSLTLKAPVSHKDPTASEGDDEECNCGHDMDEHGE